MTVASLPTALSKITRKGHFHQDCYAAERACELNASLCETEQFFLPAPGSQAMQTPLVRMLPSCAQSLLAWNHKVTLIDTPEETLLVP